MEKTFYHLNADLLSWRTCGGCDTNKQVAVISLK